MSHLNVVLIFDCICCTHFNVFVIKLHKKIFNFLTKNQKLISYFTYQKKTQNWPVESWKMYWQMFYYAITAQPSHIPQKFPAHINGNDDITRPLVPRTWKTARNWSKEKFSLPILNKTWLPNKKKTLQLYGIYNKKQWEAAVNLNIFIHFSRASHGQFNCKSFHFLKISSSNINSHKQQQ